MNDLDFYRGKKVRVRRGATVWHFTPSGIDQRIARRAQTVTVHHVMQAFNGKPDRVCWAGTGGYWREVGVGDVEVAA